jgi:hypothetical protein
MTSTGAMLERSLLALKARVQHPPHGRFQKNLLSCSVNGLPRAALIFLNFQLVL